MRITTLIEDRNHDDLGLEGEKGLSLYIQRDDDCILFDTGATGKFVGNAEKLGVDLKMYM